MLGVGVGARQHRHDRQRQRQFAVVGAGKIIGTVQSSGASMALTSPKAARCCGRPLALRRLKVKTTSAEVIGVPSENRAAGLRWKDDAIPRLVGFEALGDQAVERERLVGRARHQRLIDIADEALRGRQSLDIIGVQAVEGAEIGEIEPAALGRLRIDVGQVVEVGRQRRLAVHRDRAHRRADDARGRRRRAQGGSERGAKDGANRAADHRRTSIIGGPPIPNAKAHPGALERLGRANSGVGEARVDRLQADVDVFRSASPDRVAALAQRRNCYWNVASNVERGRAEHHGASRAPCVTMSPEVSQMSMPGGS